MYYVLRDKSDVMKAKLTPEAVNEVINGKDVSVTVRKNSGARDELVYTLTDDLCIMLGKGNTGVRLFLWKGDKLVQKFS